ncbi:MAG TPA: NUDIX hydrolase [Bdellovibrionota bacterium]|nr:NUDIX hydrolase [Bdellovibrionota bacterium]
MKNLKENWVCEHDQTLLKVPILEFVKRVFRDRRDNTRHDFYLLRSRDWVNIIPVTKHGTVVMVRQFRVGIDDVTLEFPGGVADSGDKDLCAAATRELSEETGYVPMPGATCIPLGWSHPNPAIMNNRVFSFLVGPVRKDRNQELDPTEQIDIVEIPIPELPERIRRGEITHALMLDALLSLALRSSAASAGLISELQAFVTAQAPLQEQPKS